MHVKIRASARQVGDISNALSFIARAPFLSGENSATYDFVARLAIGHGLKQEQQQHDGTGDLRARRSALGNGTRTANTRALERSASGLPDALVFAV